jgi:hypothetical protein
MLWLKVNQVQSMLVFLCFCTLCEASLLMMFQKALGHVTGAGGTHSGFWNIVTKLGSHIVQKSKNQYLFHGESLKTSAGDLLVNCLTLWITSLIELPLLGIKTSYPGCIQLLYWLKYCSCLLCAILFNVSRFYPMCLKIFSSMAVEI